MAATAWEKRHSEESVDNDGEKDGYMLELAPPVVPYRRGEQPALVLPVPQVEAQASNKHVAATTFEAHEKEADFEEKEKIDCDDLGEDDEAIELKTVAEKEFGDAGERPLVVGQDRSHGGTKNEDSEQDDFAAGASLPSSMVWSRHHSYSGCKHNHNNNYCTCPCGNWIWLWKNKEYCTECGRRWAKHDPGAQGKVTYNL